jgi:predicted glycosyltransferase
MRVLCYAQNLIGVGHFVRMLAIARGLRAAAHEVHLVDGGRAVPRRASPFDPALIELPRLVRLGADLLAEEPGRSVTEVLADRAYRLMDAAERIRPEVVLVDHYPFGRWELDAEIGGMIGAARRANAGVRVVCSVRDNLRSHYRRAEQDAHERGVLERLDRFFDEILIHTDPKFARLEETFTRVAEITTPMSYTGFVVDRTMGTPAATMPPAPCAVLSCGGSVTNMGFLLAAIEAFRRLRATAAPEALSLLVFPGPVGEAGAATLRLAIGDEPFRLFGFLPDFPEWLASSRLSVSRAGYNTCAEILASGVRSVLVPNPDNADQAPRARRLAELGLATLVTGTAPDADAIAGAIVRALGCPPARHALSLDGVEVTRARLEDSRPTRGGRSRE